MKSQLSEFKRNCMRIIKYHNCSHGKQHQTKQHKNPPKEFLMFDNGVYPETDKAKCENK